MIRNYRSQFAIKDKRFYISQFEQVDRMKHYISQFEHIGYDYKSQFEHIR